MLYGIKALEENVFYLTPDSFLITGKNPIFARKLEELTRESNF
jgi:hypothetical protein